MSGSRAGRRRGTPDTRGEILAAARSEFGDKGYDAATVRAIATRAGVDAALVHHYFSGKEKLFVAAMEFPIDPEEIAERMSDGPVSELAERMVRTFMGVWGDAQRRAPIVALLRSAMSYEAAGAMLRQFVTGALLSRVVVVFGDAPDAKMRAEAMVSHLIGLAMMRYVIQVEPLASATDDELVALVAPVLQKYVDDAVAGQ